MSTNVGAIFVTNHSSNTEQSTNIPKSGFLILESRLKSPLALRIALTETGGYSTTKLSLEGGIMVNFHEASFMTKISMKRLERANWMAPVFHQVVLAVKSSPEYEISQTIEIDGQLNRFACSLPLVHPRFELQPGTLLRLATLLFFETWEKTGVTEEARFYDMKEAGAAFCRNAGSFRTIVNRLELKISHPTR